MHIEKSYTVRFTRVIITTIQRDILEPRHDKTNKLTCTPSEDSDQPGHPPSLIRAFAVRMTKPWALIYPLSIQKRLWSDWADAQADLNRQWEHVLCCWFCHATLTLVEDLCHQSVAAHFTSLD